MYWRPVRNSGEKPVRNQLKSGEIKNMCRIFISSIAHTYLRQNNTTANTRSNTCQLRSIMKKDALSPIINFISHIHRVCSCSAFSTKHLCPPVHKIGNACLMTNYLILLCSPHHFQSLLNFQNVF